MKQENEKMNQKKRENPENFRNTRKFSKHQKKFKRLSSKFSKHQKNTQIQSVKSRHINSLLMVGSNISTFSIWIFCNLPLTRVEFLINLAKLKFFRFFLKSIFHPPYLDFISPVNAIG